MTCLARDILVTHVQAPTYIIPPQMQATTIARIAGAGALSKQNYSVYEICRAAAQAVLLSVILLAWPICIFFLRRSGSASRAPRADGDRSYCLAALTFSMLLAGLQLVMGAAADMMLYKDLSAEGAWPCVEAA